VSVSGCHIFQPNAGRDITGAQFIHLVAIVGMHQHNTPDALFLPFTGLYTASPLRSTPE
jgi:hypothetical protein